MSRKVNPTEGIRIERIWSMPNKNTFEVRPIKALIEEEVDLSNFWIDPFANRNKLASVTNDLSLEYDTDYHMDALDFLKMFEDGSVDGVLYDPPNSPRQVSECYNDVGYNVTWDTTKASFWGNHKREISRIVREEKSLLLAGIAVESDINMASKSSEYSLCHMVDGIMTQFVLWKSRHTKANISEKRRNSN